MALFRNKWFKHDPDLASMEPSTAPAKWLREAAESAYHELERSADDNAIKRRLGKLCSTTGVDRKLEKAILKDIMVNWFARKWANKNYESKAQSDGKRRRGGLAAVCEKCKEKVERVVCTNCEKGKTMTVNKAMDCADR
jgi:hypothetical protein